MSELREPHLQVPHAHSNMDYSGHLGDPRDRTSGNSRHSQSSAQSWAYTSQQNPPPEFPPPPRPLPIPVPRGVTNLDDPDPDEDEYMNIDPNGPDIESPNGTDSQRMGSPNSSKRKDGGSNFVGGFVSGLRRFPRAVMRGYGGDRRKRVRRGTAETGDTGGTSVSTLPKYEANPEPTMHNNIRYVEATEMPVEQLAPPQSYQRPPSHDLEDLYEATHEGVSTTRHSTMRHSVALHSTIHPSSARQTMLHEDQDGTPALDLLAGETSDNGLESPVLVEPQPASDYAKMGGPNVHIPTETSSVSRVFGLQRFFQTLHDLPWVASRVTADYIPGQHISGHGRGHKKPPTSWYTRPNPLEDFSPTASRRTSASPRPRRHTRASTVSHASYPYRYPTSPTDNRARRQKQTRRSTHDGTRSRSSNGHGNPLYSRGYAPYGYNYPPPPPQPLYVMHPQSHPASPTGTNVLPGYAEMRQAVPVYVVTPPSAGHEQIHESPASPISQYPTFPMPMPMSIPRIPAQTS